MAFVGLSKKLRDEIEGRINKMEEAELRGTDEPASIEVSGTEEWVLRLVWGEHFHLMNVIPATWMSQADRMSVKFTLVAEDNTGTEKEHTVTASVHCPQGYFKTPPGKSYGINVHVTGKEEYLKDWVTAYRRQYSVKQRWKLVRVQVKGFLDKCKSLNEAYKLWPQVAMYVPEHAITKLHEKVERNSAQSEAAEMLKTMDTEQLTSAAVIARMSGMK